LPLDLKIRSHDFRRFYSQNITCHVLPKWADNSPPSVNPLEGPQLNVFPPLLDFLTVAIFLIGQTLALPTVLASVITPHRHSTPEHFPDMVVYTPCISQLHLSQSNCYTKKRTPSTKILSTLFQKLETSSKHHPTVRLQDFQPTSSQAQIELNQLRCQHKKPGPSSRNSHSSLLSAPPYRG
jgi:hypothetical protein